MSEVHAERVLVVPTEAFRNAGYFQGFSADAEKYAAALFRPELTSYRPRREVEQDPSFKQLIPYVLFVHTDAQGRKSVFQYTRGTGMGEGRLHKKRSVGIGGHISIDDAAATAGANPYDEGLRRELEEEVVVDTTYESRCIGFINDDETEVGRVHLGVVHIFDVAEPNVKPREKDVCEAGFRPVEEILADMEGFETWSQICVRAIFCNR